MADHNNYLEMTGICKSFYGVNVLRDVSFGARAGAVHALVGENGAGKSTLMKILGGIYSKDSGVIKIDGKEVDIKNPKDARALKISFVHQEICLAENMSIADNVFLGIEPNRCGWVAQKIMRQKTREALDALNVQFDEDTIVEKLSVAQKQMVEIAIALCFDAKIVIMDEPTASLTNSEIRHLFEQIRMMKEKGIAIIYISHRLEEIFEIAESVTVLRDGATIDTMLVAKMSKDDIIRKMVGREIDNYYSDKYFSGSEVILKAKGLRNRYLKDVDFELKKGEVLGVFGLVGAGRTELARAVFGIDRLDKGELFLAGKKIVNKSPIDAIRRGIALVPEDRKLDGLVLGQDVAYNITLTVLNEFIHGVHIDRKREKEIIDTYAGKLSIKMSGTDQLCLNLSGGNQQKVVISKWLAAGSGILILDEPTRGIDVGAKAEIYSLIRSLVAEGLSIIMISSELPEIINMSSRIAVMHEGEMVTIMEREKEEFTQENIMHYAIGG